MKILYVSSIPSNKQFDYMKSMLKKNVNMSKYGMQESGSKFHHLILDGIKENNVEIYSLIGRPVSFKIYKKFWWKREVDKENGIVYDHLSFVNIPIIKNIILCFNFFKSALSWLRKNKKEEKCIILDAAYVTVIPFINMATKIIKCKKIAIVCDIYEYMADVKDARNHSRKIHKVIAKFMKKRYSQIDGYVFLTEAMNNVLNKLNKPYIVMEGLVDHNMKESYNELENKTDKKVVMYAGALREQYGLKNLMIAFNDYKNDDAELWVYGAGDYSPKVQEFAQIDSRIKFWGLASNLEIVKKETEANLLINPRPANQEFTKYSFPSKNMEYMVSGTPILTTRLPGMPEEYYDYIYTIEGNEATDLKLALENTLSNSKEELHDKGEKAKRFVLENKNNLIQSSRILELCKEVNKC